MRSRGALAALRGPGGPEETSYMLVCLLLIISFSLVLEGFLTETMREGVVHLVCWRCVLI